MRLSSLWTRVSECHVLFAAGYELPAEDSSRSAADDLDPAITAATPRPHSSRRLPSAARSASSLVSILLRILGN